MIASGSKKGNMVIELAGGKQASNDERQSKRKQARGADQMDLQHGTP